jgi:hypothetical protein
LHVLENFVLQRLTLHVGNDCGAYLSEIAVKKSLHDSFSAMDSALLNHANLAALVHIFGKSTDKGFVYLYFVIRATNLCGIPKRPIVQGRAKALQHKPCRLLSNPQSASNLHAANAILAVDQHPKCRHPLVHAKCGILKDRVHFERELLVAASAKPQLPWRTFPRL